MTTTNFSENNELLQSLTTLLAEQIEGIALNQLENVYKTKFGKSILAELIKLALPNELNNLFSIVLENQNNGSSDVIKLINQESNEQTQNQFIQQITASGIVPQNFRYSINPMISTQTERFVTYLSNIDQYEMLIYMQPEYHLPWMHELTELLHSYYSHPQSENLIVKDPQEGLVCVTKYDEVYHRAFIKGNLSSKYIIQYVDIGLTMIVDKNEKQFKYLLNCFAEYSCLTIPCRLVGVEFKRENSQMPPETYKELNKAFGSGGPFYIVPFCQSNGVLNVKIYDFYEQCLNTLVVQAGLANAIEIPTTPAHESNINERKTQTSQQPLNHSHKNNTAGTATVDTSNDLFGDYDTKDKKIITSKNQSLLGEYEEYDTETSSSVLIKSNSRYSNSTSTKKWDAQSNGKDSSSNSVTTKQSTIKNQQDPIRVNERIPLRITINQSAPSHRLLASAVKNLMPNNKRNDQQKLSSITFYNSHRKKDDHAEWMCCSWSKEQSLWSSDTHKNALLKYIGRVYNQVTKMHILFAQLKDMHDLDELDILNKLLINAQQRQQAQKSFNKWKDSSRITRRLQDLKIIFEYNSNSTPSNNPFIIELNGCQKIIESQTIESYFDLGCGDGTITAEIGRCLGLSKTNIFGGDVFEVRNENLTFIKLNENDAHINMPDNHVDVITSFVTFHHVSEFQKTLTEIVRILRSGGYLIIREHDCENKRSLSAKYLNFVHAIMMIAGVGEFADSQNSKNENQGATDNDYENSEQNWKKQKSEIIEYTKSIKYKSCYEWKTEFGNVGFRHRATLRYGANGSENPQNLFYAVYQLEKK